MKHSIKLFTLITLFYCLFTSCNDAVESYRETEKNIENVYPVAIKSFMRTKAAVVRNKQWEQNEKIGIKFLNGTTSQQTKIMEYAREWEKHINLRFVLDSQNPSVIIHIANPDLDEVDKVNWSYLGTDNTKIARTGEATMNLVLKSGDENTEYFKGIVLMEFGHVLGLIYEYQRYAGDLSIKYNINVDYSAINDLIFDHWRSDYEGIWELEGVSVSEEDVVHTLVQPDGEVVKLDWSFDPQSIMLPYFGNSIIYYKEFPLRNVISKPNTKLSEKDIAYIKQIYPKGDGEELQPDPFVKGRREYRVWAQYVNNWLTHYQDPRDWDKEEIVRTSWGKATYPIQEIDEYWWFAKSLITDYRFRYANDTYLNWLGYSDADINQWNESHLKVGKEALTNDTMNKFYGSPFFVRAGVWYFFGYGNVKYDDSWKTYTKNTAGQLVEEARGLWNVPDLEDILQLIGLAPRKSDHLFLDIMDFIGANSEKDDLPYRFYYNYEASSGLDLYPLGAKGGGGTKPPLKSPIDASYVDNIGESINGFGLYSAIHIGQFVENLMNTHKRLLFVSGNVFGGPGIIRIDPGYPNAVQSAQVRYCSKKSDDELGYKMYIDENNDKILILDFPLSEVDQKKVESLKELPKGLLRGIALRYTNREQRQVCNSLSEIKNEAKNYDTIIKK